ncbi:unnamed protein product [Mytilus edulis]|uniref:BESS domain-containing protein n=1 Tax=Mytilus edulis TaxID=6550 RepID=A0A8S3Q7G9_MYTED|nr:unnamed protein product [Mytilus edulis]
MFIPIVASKKTQPGFDREKLIHLVRDTACLWDPSTKEYMDSDITHSCTNLENSTSEEEGNELEVENVSVPPIKKMKSTARKNIDTQFVEFLKDSSKTLHESISQGNQKELDEEGHYGQTVAANLRRLSPQQKARAKILINQALYDVEFNTPYREVLSSRNVNNQYQKEDENEPTTYFLMN